MACLSEVCRVCCPFDAFLPNLDLIAIPSIYKPPCESDTPLARIDGNSLWGGTISSGKFGRNGKRLVSYAEILIQGLAESMRNLKLPLTIGVNSVEGGGTV